MGGGGGGRQTSSNRLQLWSGEAGCGGCRMSGSFRPELPHRQETTAPGSRLPWSVYQERFSSPSLRLAVTCLTPGWGPRALPPFGGTHGFSWLGHLEIRWPFAVRAPTKPPPCPASSMQMIKNHQQRLHSLRVRAQGRARLGMIIKLPAPTQWKVQRVRVLFSGIRELPGSMRACNRPTRVSHTPLARPCASLCDTIIALCNGLQQHGPFLVVFNVPCET